MDQTNRSCEPGRHQLVLPESRTRGAHDAHLQARARFRGSLQTTKPALVRSRAPCSKQKLALFRQRCSAHGDCSPRRLGSPNS